MTEQEWLIATDPTPLMRVLRGKVNNRKLRLFACACARRFWHRLAADERRRPPDERSWDAIKLGEAFVEGRASVEELRVALPHAVEGTEAVPVPYPNCGEAFPAVQAAQYAEAAVWEDLEATLADGDPLLANIFLFEPHSGPETEVLRCLVHPFWPMPFDPAWRTPTVSSMAAVIYEERHLPTGLFDHGRLAILADALQDAGCDNTDILGHLRGGGDHVRGCWVIDLVLGKD